MENQNKNLEVIQAEEVEVLPRKEDKGKGGVNASAGGIGVETEDVNVAATVGTGNIDHSDHTGEGITASGNVTIDKSTTINKGPSRFDSAIKMDVPSAPEAESAGLSK